MGQVGAAATTPPWNRSSPSADPTSSTGNAGPPRPAPPRDRDLDRAHLPPPTPRQARLGRLTPIEFEAIIKPADDQAADPHPTCHRITRQSPTPGPARATTPDERPGFVPLAPTRRILVLVVSSLYGSHGGPMAGGRRGLGTEGRGFRHPLVTVPIAGYVALHHRLDAGADYCLLDVACGAGLAVELASLRGARCAGIDASPRLIAIARDRLSWTYLRVGDMQALPWADETFDVVTSFRGIWATIRSAVAEAHRVLVPGGRVGLHARGDTPGVTRSVGAGTVRVGGGAQGGEPAAMVASTGRPGAGQALLVKRGLHGRLKRVDIPFVFEFGEPGSLCPCLVLHRPGVRGHPGCRRSGVLAGGRGSGPGAHT